MKLFRYFVIFYLTGLLIIPVSFSQSIESSGTLILSDLLEDLVAAGINTEDYDEIAQDLYELSEHPMDLNQADEDDLKRLHFLNDFQIYTLLEYLHEYGPIISINELQTISGFSGDVIEKIRPFIIFSNVQGNIAFVRKSIHQQIVFKYLKDMNLKKGFTGDSANSFFGKNRSLQTKYQIKSGEKWMAGFTMDQDPGESFKPPSKSFKPDFTSAFCEIHSEGLINQVILGDFRANYGQGLILSGFSQGKGSSVIVKPSGTGIKRYTSSGENDMFRGLAIRMEKKKLNLDIFYSRLRRDATIYDDSTRYFKSFNSSGLHRNTSEMEKKDVLIQTSLGAHAGYRTRTLNLGFTIFSQKNNIDYISLSDPYNFRSIAKGEYINNISTDFKYCLKKALISGEIASDYQGNISFISELIAELHPLIRYSFLYRNYHPSYFGLRSGGFGEKSNTCNEKGIYMGIEMYPAKHFKLEIFSDHYQFPFPDQSHSAPTTGNEYFMNCSFFQDNNFIISLRSRYEKNYSKTDRTETGIDLMEIIRKLSNRVELKCKILPGLEVKSRTEFSHFKKTDSDWNIGYYCANDISLESPKSVWKLWFRYAVFDIPGWNNRIYAYENDVLYGFSVPAYNSRGSRTIVLLKLSLSNKIESWLRFASTSYLGMKTTGSGPDEVTGNNDPAITVQIRIKI